MAAMTDPADELGRACDRIILTSSSGNSEAAVAKAIGVEPWSKEFYQVVFCLVDQADRIRSILETQMLSEPVLDRARTHLQGIKSAFSSSALRTSWDTSGSTRQLLREHVSPVALLSPTVARSASYPLLSGEQVASLIFDMDDLIVWLRQHQLEEHDLLRAALIDGLQTYRFRLERIGWLGWEYSAEALRATIGAYLALDRGQVSPDASPITEAVLMKTGEFFRHIWTSIGYASEVSDRVGVAIKLYGIAAMVRDGSPVIAAITHQVAN